MDHYDDLIDEMDKLLNLSLSPKLFMNFSSGYWKPSLDICETESEYVVYVELAGVRKEDISVTYQNNCLYITGSRKDFIHPDTLRYHRLELDHGSFQRKITINVPIDESHISAEHKEGILEVTLPKRREA